MNQKKLKNKENVKRSKRIIRSSLSGKIINGKEVILVEEVQDYVKKMGYVLREVNLIRANMIAVLIFAIALVFVSPYASAQISYDALNGDGAFDNLHNIDSWDKNHIGDGGYDRDTYWTYGGASSLRIYTDLANNPVQREALSTFSKNFIIEDRTYTFYLIADLLSSPLQSQSTLRVDEVYLMINEINKTAILTFAFHKNWGNVYTPEKNILKIIIEDDDGIEYLVYHNSTLANMKGIGFHNEIDVSSIINFEPKAVGLFELDLTQTNNIIFLLLFLALGTFLLYKGVVLWSGFVYVLAGSIMLFNNVNLIISIFFITIGVLIIFSPTKQKGGGI